MSDLDRALVMGFGVTGQAVARALVERGHEVVVVDDHPTAAILRTAQLLGVELIAAPERAVLDRLVGAVDVVLPSPGLPDAHPVFASAKGSGVVIMSEFDLAARWDDRPMVAITGTDGKTTVTTMVAEMFEASGLRSAAVGNTETPLVSAIADQAIDVFVVEASSFRLGHSRAFSPKVATWLNFAPDHLDVHSSMAAYESAKASIWSHLRPGAVAVANAEDEVVMRNVVPDNHTITFGTGDADFTVRDAVMVTDGGEDLVAVSEMWRSLPHDISNALAASASALHGGASLEGVRSTLRSFRGLAHRVELIAESGGVRWYDDSKATAPHATLAALSGFDSVVLIAGGRNKGLDLSVLAGAPQIREVVAIGEAAPLLEEVFTGGVPVHRVETDIAEAVSVAARCARPGDTVLLSPGCASFDWFGSYAERGEAFAEAVARHLGGVGGGRRP